MDDVDFYTPGALPVITDITEELGIVGVFNEHLDWDESQCTVSLGHRLLAILANLLTEGKPLYQLRKFYKHIDKETLYGVGIQPAHFNDDMLGRALDTLAATDCGPKQALGTALVEAAKREALDTSVIHADTTSFSVQGDYEPDDEDVPLDITHRFSKEKRPDLKQFQVCPGVNRDGVPLIGEILDGNAGDSDWNR